MSRWDALKPSSHDQSSRRRTHRAHAQETKRKPQNATGRKFDAEKSRAAFETLFRACQQQLETENVTSLANLVIKLPSSTLSQTIKSVQVVDEIFLAHLEKKLQEQHLALSREDERGILALVQALCTLLDSSCSSQHGSSIMAPLVSEIQNDGNEIQIPNPTRIRLFRDFQSLLLTPDWATLIILERVAHCLVVALKLAIRIDGTAKHAKSKNYDLDPTAVYNFFVYCRTSSLRSAGADADTHLFSLNRVALELIKALIKRHPESASSFATLLLIGDRTSSTIQHSFQSCSTCAYGSDNGATTVFLDLLHEPVRGIPCTDLLLMAVDITKAVMENSPLPLWLQPQQHLHRGVGKTCQHRGCHGQKFIKTTASGFRERLSQGLENLTEITKGLIVVGVNNTDNQAILHGCALAGCIFRLVPFSRDSSEAVRLQTVGCDLVRITVDLISTHSMQQVRQAATETLLEGMGGRVNPQGELTRMSYSIKEWLSGRQGDAFITETTELILQNVRTTGKHNGLKAQLVRAMLRTFPALFMKSKDRWESLVAYMHTCSESSNTHTRLEGALALQSLMSGRKDGVDNAEIDFESRPFTENVVPILLTMLSRDNGASIRCALLAAYGSMLPNDWHWLASSHPRIDHVHVNLILGIAQESRSSDKVRSEACKSIGDVCASYFSSSGERLCMPWDDDSQSKNICEKVCEALISLSEAARSYGVVVRASVVLAMGNLVQALRHPSIPVQCPTTLSLLPSCILAEITDDKDAKVSGNAIRTLGHVTCLLFRDDYRACIASLGFDHKWLLRSAIEAFTSRLKSAVMLARGEMSRLNWKERSIIKKHAWGASNSLASIFAAGIVSSVKDIANNDDGDQDTEEHIRECLSYLLQLVEEAHKVHEKVVVSSIIAICSMDIATLSRHCGKNQLPLTRTIVACIMLVFKGYNHEGNRDDGDDNSHALSAKVTEEAALLLEHLLRCCSISDAADVLHSQSISTPAIDYLYEWMIEKDCPTTTFDTFAQAMQKPDVQVDVQTEQRFASRSMSPLGQHNQSDEL